MTEHTKRNILVDTSIPLEGGEAIIAKLEKVAPVFVTDIVLQELDGHKNNANSSVAYRARKLFKAFGKSNGVELDVLPTDGMRLEKGDTLRRMTLGVTPLHVIVRKFYKTKDINDSKIIEIAKDYNMTLVTLDMAQCVRAMSYGVNVTVLEKKDDKTMKKFTTTKLLLIFISMSLLLIMPIVYFNLELFARKNYVENVVFIIIVLFGLSLLFAILKYAFVGAVDKINHNEYKNFDNSSSDNWITNPSKSYLDGNLFHETLH